MSRKFPISWFQALVLGFLAAGGGAVGYEELFAKSSASEQKTGPALVVPTALSPMAKFGKLAYDGTCAQCHGVNGAGTDKGPPFVHPIYNPGHHGDDAFFYAAHNGVKQHHWKFGDMPAQPQVGDQQLSAIVAYVRELQEANGIVYQEHRM
ncbi:MAG TPA: cytochrome c [Candidatus Sulfotelmatobacter sp.]|nr:cytochrome c [Candidatus Sulfotelmatobacter sp.]